MDEETRKRVQDKLEEGEEILWAGRPEPFEVQDKTHRQPMKKHTMITLLVTLAVIGSYLGAARHYGVPVIFWPIALVAAVAALTAGREWLDAGTLRRKAWYVLTNRQILKVIDSVSGVSYQSVPRAAVRVDADGHTSFLFGEDAIRKKPWAWRSLATVSAISDTNTGICDQMVFYAVPEADKVENILRQYVNLC